MTKNIQKSILAWERVLGPLDTLHAQILVKSDDVLVNNLSTDEILAPKAGARLPYTCIWGTRDIIFIYEYDDLEGNEVEGIIKKTKKNKKNEKIEKKQKNEEVERGEETTPLIGHSLGGSGYGFSGYKTIKKIEKMTTITEKTMNNENQIATYIETNLINGTKKISIVKRDDEISEERSKSKTVIKNDENQSKKGISEQLVKFLIEKLNNKPIPEFAEIFQQFDIKPSKISIKLDNELKSTKDYNYIKQYEIFEKNENIDLTYKEFIQIAHIYSKLDLKLDIETHIEKIEKMIRRGETEDVKAARKYLETTEKYKKYDKGFVLLEKQEKQIDNKRFKGKKGKDSKNIIKNQENTTDNLKFNTPKKKNKPLSPEDEKIKKEIEKDKEANKETVIEKFAENSSKSLFHENIIKEINNNSRNKAYNILKANLFSEQSFNELIKIVIAYIKSKYIEPYYWTKIVYWCNVLHIGEKLKNLILLDGDINEITNNLNKIVEIRNKPVDSDKKYKILTENEIYMIANNNLGKKTLKNIEASVADFTYTYKGYEKFSEKQSSLGNKCENVIEHMIFEAINVLYLNMDQEMLKVIKREVSFKNENKQHISILKELWEKREVNTEDFGGYKLLIVNIIAKFSKIISKNTITKYSSFPKFTIDGNPNKISKNATDLYVAIREKVNICSNCHIIIPEITNKNVITIAESIFSKSVQKSRWDQTGSLKSNSVIMLDSELIINFTNEMDDTRKITEKTKAVVMDIMNQVGLYVMLKTGFEYRMIRNVLINIKFNMDFDIGKDLCKIFKELPVDNGLIEMMATVKYKHDKEDVEKMIEEYIIKEMTDIEFNDYKKAYKCDFEIFNNCKMIKDLPTENKCVKTEKCIENGECVKTRMCKIGAGCKLMMDKLKKLHNNISIMTYVNATYPITILAGVRPTSEIEKTKFSHIASKIPKYLVVFNDKWNIKLHQNMTSAGISIYDPKYMIGKVNMHSDKKSAAKIIQLETKSVDVYQIFAENAGKAEINEEIDTIKRDKIILKNIWDQIIELKSKTKTKYSCKHNENALEFVLCNTIKCKICKNYMEGLVDMEEVERNKEIKMVKQANKELAIGTESEWIPMEEAEEYSLYLNYKKEGVIKIYQDGFSYDNIIIEDGNGGTIIDSCKIERARDDVEELYYVVEGSENFSKITGINRDYLELNLNDKNIAEIISRGYNKLNNLNKKN